MSLRDPLSRDWLLALPTRMQTESWRLYDIDHTRCCMKVYMYVFACYWWSCMMAIAYVSLFNMMVVGKKWVLEEILIFDRWLYQLPAYLWVWWVGCYPFVPLSWPNSTASGNWAHFTYDEVKVSFAFANSLTPEDHFASFVHGCVWERRRMNVREKENMREKRYQVK